MRTSQKAVQPWAQAVGTTPISRCRTSCTDEGGAPKVQGPSAQVVSLAVLLVVASSYDVESELQRLQELVSAWPLR